MNINFKYLRTYIYIYINNKHMSGAIYIRTLATAEDTMAASRMDGR